MKQIGAHARLSMPLKSISQHPTVFFSEIFEGILSIWRNIKNYDDEFDEWTWRDGFDIYARNELEDLLGWYIGFVALFFLLGGK